MRRWTALVTYRIEDAYGVKDDLSTTAYDIEELSELQDLIEQGPDWNTIVSVQVLLNRRAAAPDEPPL